MKKFLLAIALVSGLGGCTTMAQMTSSIASSLSSSTPSQVNTLAAATQSATLITLAVDTYVKSGTPNRATLLELQALSNAVHSALTELRSAELSGRSLTFDSFNAAIDAFNSYATTEGISH